MATNPTAGKSGTLNKGALITAAISLAAMGAIGATFLTNASPYVTVDQALHSHGDNLHLAGNILKPTLHSDLTSRKISFTVQDADGKTLPVVYTGEAISNIADADRVVAIGGMEGGVFHSTKMLIKCPSKYGDTNPLANQLKDGQQKANSYEESGRKGI